MYYNSSLPIAVFLGPSLERTQAAQILTANYYPPAQMGDIYCLLASGVRIIVLIDGIFHTAASVWPRELLEALNNDILIIGASSMGALRAVELNNLGMIGHGLIFEWYRTGVINSDDEVILNHADETLNFRPFSEPLVNIRYNLMRAVETKCISPDQGYELIDCAKKTYYADRSYQALFDSSVVKEWPPKTQARLRRFIRQQVRNLKKEDAIGALNYCAQVAKYHKQKADITPAFSRNRYYHLVRYHNRGFLYQQDRLIKGKTLLAAALKDAHLIKTLRPILIKNFFLLLWAKQKEPPITCPSDYLDRCCQQWQTDQISRNNRQWLQANGLTEREFQAALTDRALLTWLTEQLPSRFGLDFKPYTQLATGLLALKTPVEKTIQGSKQEVSKTEHLYKWLKQMSDICYLAAWTRENGIACPQPIVEEFIAKWEEMHLIHRRERWLEMTNMSGSTYLDVLAAWACCEWLIEKGPPYFGYTAWSFEVALLKELQITGQAAHIAAHIIEETRGK